VPPAPAAEVLTAECRAALGELGPTEIVVAVHAVNRASSIAQILDAIEDSIAKHLPSSQAAVLVADGGSQDGCRDAVQAWCGAAQRGPARRRSVDPAPPLGPGRAVLALLAAGRQLGASGVAVVDADLAAGGAEWLPALIHPIVEGRADYVSPAYSRTAAEGTLTTNLLAPITRALYGRRVQQVTGGCAALAAPFLDHWLDGGVGAATPHVHGVEIALTTAALAARVRLGEAHLGRRFVDPRVPQLDLATTLVRTVGPVFDLIERYRDVWEQTQGSTAVPCFGDAPAVLPGARRPAVDAMVRAFGLGLKDLLPVWEQIMPEATLARLYPLALLEADEFEFAPALWARVVVDFAVAHHERRLPRDHLLRALTPLYLGRVAAFLRGAWAASPRALAEVFEQIGRAFETEQEGLAARWR
jgi:hypothetical protein